jgi:8-oxo-dGTP pyrophosphatase MutT (NUDIX family)
MYDGSISCFELVRFLDGAFTFAITQDKKILVTLQSQPSRTHAFLSLPGGAFDSPLEDPLLCAKRELLEET